MPPVGRKSKQLANWLLKKQAKLHQWHPCANPTWTSGVCHDLFNQTVGVSQTCLTLLWRKYKWLVVVHGVFPVKPKAKIQEKTCLNQISSQGTDCFHIISAACWLLHNRCICITPSNKAAKTPSQAKTALVDIRAKTHCRNQKISYQWNHTEVSDQFQYVSFHFNSTGMQYITSFKFAVSIK